MSDLEIKGRIYEANEEIKEVSGAIGTCAEKIRSTANATRWSGAGFDIYTFGLQLENLKEDVSRGQELHRRLKTLLRDKVALKKRLAG